MLRDILANCYIKDVVSTPNGACSHFNALVKMKYKQNYHSSDIFFHTKFLILDASCLDQFKHQETCT